MVLSASAKRSAPGTAMAKVSTPAVSTTVPVKVWPLTVRVTVSPALASPPTLPVTVIAGGFGGVEDVVGGDVRIEGDRRQRRRRVDAVAFAVAGAAAVAGGVGGGDRGGDGLVGVSREVGAGDGDGKAEHAGVVDHETGEVLAVDRQGDGVARLGVATDRAGDGDIASDFGGVEDVVGGDVRIEGDRRQRRLRCRRCSLRCRCRCCRRRRWW